MKFTAHLVALNSSSHLNLNAIIEKRGPPEKQSFRCFVDKNDDDKKQECLVNIEFLTHLSSEHILRVTKFLDDKRKKIEKHEQHLATTAKERIKILAEKFNITDPQLIKRIEVGPILVFPCEFNLLSL